MEKLRFALKLIGMNLFALFCYLTLSIPINYRIGGTLVRAENFPNDFAVGLPQIYYQFEDFHGWCSNTIFFNIAISCLALLIFLFAWWLKIIPEESKSEQMQAKRLKSQMKWQLLLVGIVFPVLTLQCIFRTDNIPLYTSLLILFIVHIVLYKNREYIERKSLELSEKEEEDDIY